jgi:hypothetical protein
LAHYHQIRLPEQPWKRKLSRTVHANDQAAYSNGRHEHIKKQGLTFVNIGAVTGASPSIFVNFSDEYAASQLSISIDSCSNSKYGNWQAALKP